jgi:ankyrin repeat protein
MTPLHYAFHGNSRINLRVVRHLLDARAGPSARDVNGDTPLYFAMSNDCVDFASILQTPVLLLLQHDASLLNSMIGGYSQRPLEVALCLGGHYIQAKILCLLEAGADVHFRTRTNETIVHLILKLPIATTNRDSYDLWKTILKRVVGQGVDLSVQSSAEGDSVFHLAVRGSCDDSVIEILHSGTNVDLSLPTIRGRNTALHEAMRTSFPYAEQKARTLIRLGANLHTRNSSGETALHLACSSRHIPASILDCAREPKLMPETSPILLPSRRSSGSSKKSSLYFIGERCRHS